jgi:hypothetical protein
VATIGHMAIIFRNGIHKMYDDNGSCVTSLAAPVRINQYVFGNMCDKLLEEGKCYSRDFLFNSQAHWNGHGNIAGTRRLDAHRKVFVNWQGPSIKINWQGPAMKINFTS